MQQWGCCTSCKTLQQKENRTQIFFQLMNKHIIYIPMYRKINNRLQNNVIFLFCHSASVIAVTVFLWTCEDNWSYFCCLHPEAGLYKRLSLWLLSQGRGEGRGNEKRKKKKKKRGRIREERRCSEHRRNQLRAQQCREDESRAWNVRGREVSGSESDSSYLKSPTVTVWSAAGVNTHSSASRNQLLLQQQLSWYFNLTRRFTREVQCSWANLYKPHSPTAHCKPGSY